MEMWVLLVFLLEMVFNWLEIVMLWLIIWDLMFVLRILFYVC